jgi:uncharacterized protein YndB with AHSA1/START domain
MTTAAQTYTVVSTRVFDAPVERVWAAWCDQDKVKRWWGPHGFSVPVARMDVRVGGVSLVGMRAPAEYGLPDMYNTWTYTAVVPPERLEFIVHFTDAEGRRLAPAQLGLPPGIPNSVPHVVVFKPLGPHRTELTQTEYGYTTEQARDMSKAGLEQVLDKLAALFSPAAPATGA